MPPPPPSVPGVKCALQVIGKSMPNHPLGAADISIAGWVESQVLNPARGLRGHYETSDFCRAACQRDPADCNGRQGRAAVRESLPLDGLRSAEHQSELQSLMRSSFADFRL